MTAAIDSVCRELGVAPSPDQVGALDGFLGLLQRWNATYNLTAVRDPAQMLTHHLADCLAVVAPLQRRLGDRAAPRLLDVGSGGGLPGAVLAIMLPTLDVTCVDTVGKKAAFVRQVAAELRLRNLHGEHARVEAMASQYDVVASRAFASLADFARLSRPRLADDGVWLAMKGKHPAQEIAELPADIDVFHVEPLAVPSLDAERCLVWMRARKTPRE
jgi:16S rRNA (guanine527-N7)-methyltransferase